MIVAVVRFTLSPPLTAEQAQSSFEQSAPAYRSVPGLVRKHFLVSADGTTAGGVYLWETSAAAEAFYDDAWRARLAAKFGSPPSVELFSSPVTVDAGGVAVG